MATSAKFLRLLSCKEAFLQKLVTAIAALTFMACFNYKSIMILNEEGGGSLSVQIQIPLNEAYTIEIEDYKEKLDSIDGWQTTSISLDTIDTTAVFRLEGTFSSVSSAASPFEADSFSFSREKSGSITKFILYKKYDPTEEAMVAAKDRDFDPDDYCWSEELVGPGRIVKHNADNVYGDTLIWERRTVDVLQKGLVIDAVWEKED